MSLKVLSRKSKKELLKLCSKIMGLIDCTCRGINPDCPRCYGRGLYDSEVLQNYEIDQKKYLSQVKIKNNKKASKEIIREKLFLLFERNELNVNDFSPLFKHSIEFNDAEIVKFYQLFLVIFNQNTSIWKEARKMEIEYAIKFIDLFTERKIPFKESELYSLELKKKQLGLSKIEFYKIKSIKIKKTETRKN